MAQSVTAICNRALQIIGAARIVSLTDQSVNARQCNTCYDMTRQSELRKHPWNFAIQRFQLPASANPPAFGPANYFPLPPGWLRVLPPDPIQNYGARDWIIEGGQIVSSATAPLNVRCVMDILDTTLMDAAFCESLAARMAFNMCEAITQSNTKQQACVGAYKLAIDEAKKTNAIEKVPQDAPVDEWITARINSVGGIGPGWGAGF